MIKAKTILTMLIFYFISGCMSNDKIDENFIRILSNDVGKPFNEAIKHRRGYIGVRVLNNGNKEHEYLVSTPNCHVFQEVDSRTNIVIGWRYEASNPVEDCYIVP